MTFTYNCVSGFATMRIDDSGGGGGSDGGGDWRWQRQRRHTMVNGDT